MSRIELAIDLMEEAVFLAMTRGGRVDARLAEEWQRAREPLYAAAPGPARDRSFQAHARTWFARLGLGGPIERALRACPRVLESLATVEVRRVVRIRDEGSDLFGSSDPAAEDPRPRRMILGLHPSRFLDPDALGEIALREFLYADDTLDPAFGFEPVFAPDLSDEPARRELARDRFRVLWEARVNGRMARAGDPSARPPAPSARFRAAFGSCLEQGDAQSLFENAWLGRLSTCAALVGAATSGLERLAVAADP